jgi:hypothetical protein
LFIAVALILLTLINCGALLEQKRWIYYLEGIRFLALSGWISYESESFTLFAVSVGAVLFFGTNESVEKWYFQFVYSE